MAASENHEIATAVEPGIWVWDHDRRRIVWANESALHFWGERTVLDLIDRDFAPSDPATEQFARLLHAASASDAARARLTLTTASGPRRVAASAARFTLNDGRTGLRIIAMPLPVGMESEPERMREIFATAPQAMTLFAEDGSLMVQNDAADLIFGTGDLAGLAARYGTSGTARDALRALLVSGSFSHAHILNTRSGLRRHRVTMRRMLDPVTGAFAALATFTDAVERSDAAQLIAPGEQGPAQSLLAAVEAGIAVYDDALKPLYMNDHARHIMGIALNAPAPQLMDRFPDDRNRIASALLDIRDGRTDTATIDLPVQAGSDPVRWIQLFVRRGDWQGASAWVATITDISQTRRTAIAMQRAIDDRDDALEAIGVGVAILRGDGAVAQMNATAASLIGRERDSQHPLIDAFDATGAAAFAEAFEEESNSEAMRVTLLDTSDQLLVGIGPKDRFNRNYRTVTLRAVERQRGDKPGIFERREAVARASHELRTPLNAIIGFTQLMLESPEPIHSKAYVDYLKDINDSGTYMLGLLQDLLDMRRIEADTLRLDTAPVDLGNLLRVVARETGFAARKRDVEVILSVEPDLPPILADMHTIRQAFTNIVGNAVKFAAPSGWVRISAVQRASGAVQVEVIDNGAGMTPEELTIALEPFGQMPGNQQKFGGAGMGVPLAKGFIEANKARFELTSEKHLGTIARIVFSPDQITVRK